jgi:putative tryptophan/tyrosine transport system substrate-binding protein
VLLNPLAPSAKQSKQAVEAVARGMGGEPLLFEARGPEDYPAAFQRMRAAGVRSLVISANAWFARDRELLGELSRAAGIVTMCEWGDMAQSACTMGYGPVRSDVYDRTADQLARILQGSHPREIPVEQPRRFELVINVIGARSLGTTISPTLLARADAVIE